MVSASSSLTSYVLARCPCSIIEVLFSLVGGWFRRERRPTDVGRSDLGSQRARSSHCRLRTRRVHAQGRNAISRVAMHAFVVQTLPHGRVNIKIGRLKASTPLQSRQHATSHDRKNRSRSSSSNFRRTSASKVNDR